MVILSFWRKPCNTLLLITLLIIIAVYVHGETASDTNRQAIDKAQKGKLDEALELFTRTVKLEPRNAEYRNNLGVTHMRKGNLDKAEKCFLKALKLDVNNPDAAQNLKDLKAFQLRSKAKAAAATTINDDDDDDNDSNDDEPAPRQWKKPPPRMPLPRIPLADFYKPEWKEYAELKKPFKLVGEIPNWPASKLWTDDWLMRNFPDSIVDFYPHNMDKADTHPYLTALPQALREMYRPSGQFPSNSIRPGTYLQWNINYTDWRRLVEDLRLPYQFRADDDWIDDCLSTVELRSEFSKRTHWKMMLISNKGAGMFGHQDVLRTSSWQVQLRGAKKWFICAPDQKPYLYHAGNVDAWNWDSDKWPLFEHAKCYEDVINEGEIVYYPRDYWHQTENLKASNLAISSTISDALNHDLIAGELKNECDWKKFKWGFSKELCDELPKCWALWKNRYTPSPDMIGTSPLRR